MNIFEYISKVLKGSFTEDYATEVRDYMKAQAEKRREEVKEKEKE
jgi:hypothetical protein